MKLWLLFYLVFFLTASIAFAQSSRKLQAEFDSLRNTGRRLVFEGKLDSVPALQLNRRLLQLAEQIKSDSTYALAYNAIGIYFSARSDYSQALEYDFKALEAAKKNFKGHLAIVYGSIANVYTALGSYGAALQYLHTGQQYLQYDNEGAKVFFPILFANVYNELHKPDSTLKYVQLAYQLNMKEKAATEFKRKSAYGLNQGNIYRAFALVYEQLDEPDLVNYYYKKGISFCDSVHLQRTLSSTANSYCSYLVKRRKYVEAKNYAVLSFDIAKRSGFKVLVAEAAGFLYAIHKQHARSDSAYYYLEEKNLYLDSVTNDQRKNRLQNTLINQQLHEAEQNAQAAAQAEQRKHNIEYAAIGLGIVIFMMIFLLLSRSLIVSARVIEAVGVIAALIVFEFINLIVHPFLAHLTNHSPLLMLFILVVLGAVIVPLHHKMDQWIKNKVVKKNKAIRLEAAKRTIEKHGGGE
jgi:hypothetical protein